MRRNLSSRNSVTASISRSLIVINSSDLLPLAGDDRLFSQKSSFFGVDSSDVGAFSVVCSSYIRDVKKNVIHEAKEKPKKVGRGSILSDIGAAHQKCTARSQCFVDSTRSISSPSSKGQKWNSCPYSRLVSESIDTRHQSCVLVYSSHEVVIVDDDVRFFF